MGVTVTVFGTVVVLVAVNVVGCDGNATVVVTYTVVQYVEVMTIGGGRRVSWIVVGLVVVMVITEIDVGLVRGGLVVLDVCCSSPSKPSTIIPSRCSDRFVSLREEAYANQHTCAKTSSNIMAVEC